MSSVMLDVENVILREIQVFKNVIVKMIVNLDIILKQTQVNNVLCVQLKIVKFVQMVKIVLHVSQLFLCG